MHIFWNKLWHGILHGKRRVVFCCSETKTRNVVLYGTLQRKKVEESAASHSFLPSLLLLFTGGGESRQVMERKVSISFFLQFFSWPYPSRYAQLEWYSYMGQNYCIVKLWHTFNFRSVLVPSPRQSPVGAVWNAAPRSPPTPSLPLDRCIISHCLPPPPPSAPLLREGKWRAPLFEKGLEGRGSFA